MNATIISPSGKSGKLNKDYLVLVNLKHDHNHPVHAADTLRFRPIAEDTRRKHYELFKLGHSPASAHLEYETTLLLIEISILKLVMFTIYSVYGEKLIWEQEMERMCIYEKLERRVAIYNNNKSTGGKAVV